MKKSIFNIFRKIKENIYIVFNSNSLAIAEADEIFQKIYNNLDNLNLNKFSAEEKETFEQMHKLNFIVDDETDEMKNLEYLRLKKIADMKTFNLAIFPTLGCNFDCYYCYEKNKSGIISKEVQEKILELIEYYAEKKIDIKITWHGGEPLLVFDIIYDLSQKMIEICNRNNVKYISEMKTNGYLFDDQIISRLKKCKVSFIQITVDGPPDKHNKIRYLKTSKQGTFDRILENVKKLKANNLNPWIVVNINKSFRDDDLIRFVEILIDNGLEYNFSFFPEKDSNSGDKYYFNEKCFTNSELAKFSMDFYKKLYEMGLGKLVEKNFMPSKINNYCEATRFSYINIDPDGFFYKCALEVGITDKAIGNIIDTRSCKEKFNFNLVNYMTWDPFKFEKCKNCNIIPICAGNCPKIGLDNNNEPYCIRWKYNIEEFIELIAQNKYED